MATKHPIGDHLRQCATLLGISPARVLRRLGLSETLAQEDEVLVDAQTYFNLFDAICAEVNRPGLELELALSYAHGPFVPPIFAFSCAETLAMGVSRLSDFKPLIGPMRMEVTRPDQALKIVLAPSVPGISVSPSLGLFELLYITECARTFSGTKVTPVDTTLPVSLELDADSLAYLGRAPRLGPSVSLTFSAEDADIPLITRSDELWDTLEPGFLDQLRAHTGVESTSGRIKHALIEALPGGATSLNDMARRMHVSKRSLQRKLNEEGTSFQELLSETRRELSERYLSDSELSVPEISYLLGFRDTSSFFRAFQGWTGMTPAAFRDQTHAALNTASG